MEELLENHGFGKFPLAKRSITVVIRIDPLGNGYKVNPRKRRDA